MNPHKCAFGVSAGQFLGFMVHERGIEITHKTITAIDKVVAPANKTELQSLIAILISFEDSYQIYRVKFNHSVHC